MKQHITQAWASYFQDIGITPDIAERYIAFVALCVEKGIPPIFEQGHLAKLVGRHPDDLMSMVFGSDSFYREFKLKKRSGGFRTIRAPYPSLLEVQRWINESILVKKRLPNCVTGFRNGYSILDNARMHCGRRELMKIDIKDFFPSISFRRVMDVYLDFGYPQNVAFFLSRLCTLDDQLPQGAATSPALSNIICERLDKRLYSLCRKQRLRYTRYADDITISGKQIPEGVAKLFLEIIAAEGFVINEDKLRFLREGEKKVVTGLDITSGVPRVTRSFRRDLQKDVYFVWSAGLSTHVARRRLFAPNYIAHLEGRVRFWESVEPDSRQMKRTLERVVSLRGFYS